MPGLGAGSSVPSASAQITRWASLGAGCTLVALLGSEHLAPVVPRYAVRSPGSMRYVRQQAGLPSYCRGCIPRTPLMYAVLTVLIQYAVRKAASGTYSSGAPGASCPAPPVSTARRRPVGEARALKYLSAQPRTLVLGLLQRQQAPALKLAHRLPVCKMRQHPPSPHWPAGGAHARSAHGLGICLLGATAGASLVEGELGRRNQAGVFHIPLHHELDTPRVCPFLMSYVSLVEVSAMRRVPESRR